jgi:hypothetical protein
MAIRRSNAEFLGAVALVVAVATVSTSASSQEQAITEQTAAGLEAASATLPAAAEPETVEPAVPPLTIPEGTFIMIQLDGPVTSRTATRGDMFPISLAEPVIIDGVEVVPAGITGEGQVVHAAGKGFGGRAGELIVAARYLMWDEQRIALRGMRISAAGRNNTAEAIAASAVLTVAGLFVTGTSVDLPAGQIAVARLAQDIPVGPADAGVEAQASDSAVAASEDGATPASSVSNEVQQGGLE